MTHPIRATEIVMLRIGSVLWPGFVPLARGRLPDDNVQCASSAYGLAPRYAAEVLESELLNALTNEHLQISVEALRKRPIRK